MINLKENLVSVGITLTPIQEQQFEQYYQMLVAANEQFNLTTIIKKDEVYVKHFYDSIITLDYTIAKNTNSLCDIGSGAGFPGIPLKIVYPHLSVTLIEPTSKKVMFLKSVIETLQLDKTVVINARAEEAINQYREKFDVVTARAVARLNILSELCIPFVRVGGLFVSLKGALYQEELDEALPAITKLSGRILQVKELVLPHDLGKRGLILVEKVAKTNPMFPRNYATLKKRPL
jgi:16S rRNA (guanine527-N7)-methyltransferase